MSVSLKLDDQVCNETNPWEEANHKIGNNSVPFNFMKKVVAHSNAHLYCATHLQRRYKALDIIPYLLHARTILSGCELRRGEAIKRLENSTGRNNAFSVFPKN